MKRMSPSRGSRIAKITFADFLKAGAERLRLSVVVGGDRLSREIDEPMVNRPGLALTGFFEHFAWERLQLFGNAETAYLRSLPDDERLSRIRSLFEHKALCVVYTSGHKPRRDEIRVAEEAGAIVMTSPLKTRALSHHSAFVLERLCAPKTSLYGTMVEVCGIGVLFEGDPGMGKSETALGLIKRGHALVADDLTCIRKDVANNILYASAGGSTRNYMEIRGIGILHVPSIFGVTAVRAEKQLDLLVTFRRMEDVNGELDRVGDEWVTTEILGVPVPEIIIPVSVGRDLVNLVEIAAQQFKLRTAGYDPVAALDEQLKRRALS